MIIDDTPEAVGSLVHTTRFPRRSPGCRTLIEDGADSSGRIRRMWRRERAASAKRDGEAADRLCTALEDPQRSSGVVKVLGRLKFRTSYARTSCPRARGRALAGNMAAEMGLDVQMTRRAGLLHDVGKGLTHEQELTHVELGYRLCKRHKEPDLVLNSIKAHHDEEPHRYPEAWLVTAADAISGSRPGARRENVRGLRQALSRSSRVSTSEHPRGRAARLANSRPGGKLRVMVGRGGLRRWPCPHLRSGGPQDRERTPVPRTDQGCRNPRDPGRRLRALVVLRSTL